MKEPLRNARNAGIDVPLFRAECLSAVGMHRLARRVETLTQRGRVTLDEQIVAVDLEVELASSAGQRRVWRAVVKTLRAVARRSRT